MGSTTALELQMIRYMLYPYTKLSVVSATVNHVQPELISEFFNTPCFQFIFFEMFCLIDLVT